MSTVSLEALELKAITAVQTLRLRSEELTADVERLKAENKLLKTNLKQTEEQLSIERKQSERERAAWVKERERAEAAVEKERKQLSKRVKGQGVDGLFPKAESSKAESLHKLTLAEKICLCLFQVDAPLTRDQITFYTGMSPTSGPMRAAYAEATEAEWIAQGERAGSYVLTEAGAERLAELQVHAPELPSGRQIFDKFCEREGGMVEIMARALFALGVGAAYTREQIANQATIRENRRVSAASGPARAAFARLSKLSIIEGRSSYSFTPWVVAIVEPISVKVRDTTTGQERRVTVK